MNYIQGIRIPKFAKLYIVKEFKLLSNTANHNVLRMPNDEWRYYFCVAILRHFSYNKYCTPLRPGARRIEQRAAYNKFLKGFMDVVSVTIAGWLQIDEKDLKHETFGCYPALFDVKFQTNERLIRDIESVYADNEDPGKPPHTRAFVERLQEKLRREWIEVDDPVDVLSGKDKKYDKYCELESRYPLVLGLLEHWKDALPEADNDDDDHSIVPMHGRTDDNGNFLVHEDAANSNNNTRANGSAQKRADGTLRDATNRDTRPTVMLLAPPVFENYIENVPPRITRPLWEVREAPGIENGRPSWTAVYR